jgi:hypothetical protein
MQVTQYTKTSDILFTAIVLMFVLFLSGCASKNPSEADAKKVFQNTWAWHIKNGKIEIISFKKTNEHTGTKIGIRFYTIEYEAEIKVSGLDFGDWQRLRSEGPIEKQKESEHGELLKIWGQATFAQTRKGWKGEDGETY